MSPKKKGCQIYSSDRFRNIYGENIEIVDTSGVYSRDDILPTVEEIDDIILKKRGQIVGVAVIVDVSQRELSQEGESFLFSYLDALRLRHSVKAELFFCVISKYDRYYEDTEANATVYAQFA